MSDTPHMERAIREGGLVTPEEVQEHDRELGRWLNAHAVTVVNGQPWQYEPEELPELIEAPILVMDPGAIVEEFVGEVGYEMLAILAGPDFAEQVFAEAKQELKALHDWEGEGGYVRSEG